MASLVKGSCKFLSKCWGGAASTTTSNFTRARNLFTDYKSHLFTTGVSHISSKFLFTQACSLAESAQSLFAEAPTLFGSETLGKYWYGGSFQYSCHASTFVSTAAILAATLVTKLILDRVLFKKQNNDIALKDIISSAEYQKISNYTENEALDYINSEPFSRTSATFKNAFFRFISSKNFDQVVQSLVSTHHKEHLSSDSLAEALSSQLKKNSKQ